MATKRTTKQQREQQEIAALTQRLADIYSGACGFGWIECEHWPMADDLSRIVPAVKGAFEHQVDASWPWSPANLSYWDSPSSLAAFLHRAGFRA